MSLNIIDQRDTILCHSFAAIGGKPEYMQVVYDECFRNNLWPIKNVTFTFKNAEGYRQKILYEKFLIYLGVNPYCSGNFDQYTPYVIWLCKDKQTLKLLQYVLGFIVRLGFAGNNFEHIIIKPDTLAIVANYFKLYPLKWLYEFTYGLGNIITLKRSLEDETTNKIRLYLYYTYCASSLYKRFLRLFSKDIDKLFQSAMYIYWTNGNKEWLYKLFYKE